ncbi:RICIN domain-containing protein [Streptomyces sp. NPDC050121]|uniref:RICIN domain-containing protein n=1 Tax=Streptomyces sp. NPDC050121 TaxID=3365601 RepID=UPI0037B833E8
MNRSRGCEIHVFTGLDLRPWTLTDAGNGYYELKNVNSGLHAGVAQSSTVDGASVVQWNDLNVDDQLWKIVRIN